MTPEEIKITQDDYNIAGIYTYADLLKRMQSGLKFGTVSTYRDGTQQYNAVLSADAHYIRWNRYGSSAHRANVKELQFIIETVFEMTLPQFIRAFVWAY